MLGRIVGLAGAAMMAGLFLSQVAVAGSLQFTNCSKSQIWVRTFNSNDAVRFIPYAEGCVQPSKSATFGCATSSCFVSTKSGVCSPGGGILRGPMKSGSYTYYSQHSIGKGTTCK